MRALRGALARPRPLGFDGAVSVLFLENHDSFSWNVVDRLPVARAAIRVVDGAEVVRGGELSRLLGEVSLVVIGPGPTDPVRAGVVDAVRIAVAREKPVLGICLGHQAIGLAFGARLVPVTPVHGKQSRVTFTASRSFPGIRGEVVAMRYHSLALSGVAPPLRVVATSEDGTPMAIEHERHRVAGLQFHPDSFGTPRGEEILAAFFRELA